MTDSGRKKLGEDLHILLGVAIAQYDMSKDDVIDILQEMQDGIESGRYDVHFAAGRSARDRDADVDQSGPEGDS